MRLSHLACHHYPGEAISTEPVHDLGLPFVSQPDSFQEAGPGLDLSTLEQDSPPGDGYAPFPSIEGMGLRITPEMTKSLRRGGPGVLRGGRVRPAVPGEGTGC